MCSAVISAFVCACVALGATDTDVRPEQAVTVCDAIERHASSAGFDPVEVAAIAFRESRFDHKAVGKRGELGPMQVMPFYATGSRGPFTRAELATVDGGIRAGIWALTKWRKAQPGKYKACYASGTICKAYWALKETDRFETFIRKHLHEQGGGDGH
jgi:soluble lytic murein transglycosylase-like protein